MAVYDFDLYDSVVFGATPDLTQSLFQVGEGADATHVREFTNMRGAGSLPQGEEFLVRSIHCISEMSPPQADIEKIYQDSYLEFILNNLSILRSPLRVFASHSDWSGQFTQAAAADITALGAVGMGRSLSIPVLIKGGTGFKVNLYNGTALSANHTLRILLRGDLKLS